MIKYKTLIKSLLLILIIIPGIILSGLFFPDVQKYIIKNQLSAWISDAHVDYIHITPFSIQIESLNFSYDTIDISIEHLESRFSPLELLQQRIKIDTFIADKLIIDDNSLAKEDSKQSALLFPGLFPYLDTGFLIDIGMLDIKADYNSPVTGPVKITLAAQSINETTENPLKLQIAAAELPDIPDVKGLTLDATIHLQQHLNTPIDAKSSLFNIKLTSPQGIEQAITIQLAMKQLAAPNRWDSFPFDKHRTHYLQKLLHPESINLQIKHRIQDKLLSEIDFTGQYNGNEGIISGSTKIHTDKNFLQAFKTLNLPKIDSSISATFQYNTRLFQGYINLLDDFKIEDYLSFVVSDQDSSTDSSLPEKIALSNHLVARIDEDKVVINSLSLSLFNDGKDYIKLLAHKPIKIDLNNLAEFLDQENSEFMSVDINQVPLGWFNDFLPEHKINSGFIDTNINLALSNKTLKLVTHRAVNLTQFNLTERKSDLTTTQTEEKTSNLSTEKDQDIIKIPDSSSAVDTAHSLLKNQHLKADFVITINKDNLNAEITQLTLFEKNKDAVRQQAAAALSFNLKKPLDDNAIQNQSMAALKGNIDIHALLKMPLINNEIKKLLSESSTPLSQSLPKKLALNFDFSLTGKASHWEIKNSLINLTGSNAKKTKNKSIFKLKNTQAIHLQQQAEKIQLLTSGDLITAQINQFNINWLTPFVEQYAKPYLLSGYLNKLDMTLSAQENNHYKLAINQLNLNQLKAYQTIKNKQKLLFKKINFSTQLAAQFTDNRITIRYPSLSIKKSNSHLIKNSGQIVINNPGDKDKQSITVNGKLNSSISNLMQLDIARQFTAHSLSNPSLLDAKYNIMINTKKLTINKSEFQVLHPQSKGKLTLTTLKPISLSLDSKKHNFSQNGQLTIKLNNFDIKPYESLFPDIPISFDHANGHFDLIQKSKKQTITLKQPLTITNAHFKESDKALLNPFNLVLDFAARQNKNITRGEIKQLTIDFINDSSKEHALDLQTQFKIDLDKEIPLSELNGNLKLVLTQWLDQPAALPDNTLSQGTLSSEFSINDKHQIKHQWLINNLVDKQGEKIVKSISIDGSGQLESLSNFKLTLPIVMNSISGQSNLILKTQTTLMEDKKKLSLNIDGQEIFLNDLLKLLATINPQSELAQLEADKKDPTKTSANKDNAENTDSSESAALALDKTPAEQAFWQSGFDITSQLKIKTLFYSDYMSYNDIAGELIMNDQQLHANDFKIKFHDSPMNLNSRLNFNKDNKKPYNIIFNTTLSQFGIGTFLKELNPEHIPRAEGVFDVAIKLYGDLSNLSQIRNELLFDINIEGKNGIYHLIPSNDVMMRSSGAAMAVMGEVVSVLPTSGFGLGIVNRVIRFAKDINYDFIQMHLVRHDDLNTSIETFQILSPELRIFATGGLTFKENTRLFDQPLEMIANMNLAGEGAAIFYGLGLLKDKQDDYGFWQGPEINFTGTLNHQEDNFDEIISQAKSGTLLGGITNPFSGIIGNFKYRWFGDEPEYQHITREELPLKNTVEQTLEQAPVDNEANIIKKESIKESPENTSFFDATF